MANSHYCENATSLFNLTSKGPRHFDRFLYNELDTFMLTRVLPSLWLAGMILNSAFLYTIFKSKKMRTVTNIYLANLAVADILYLCTGIGNALSRYWISVIKMDVMVTRELGCIAPDIAITCYYASFMLVTLVTLEKYWAICRPIYHRLVSGKKRTVKLVLAMWAIAFCLGLCTAISNIRIESHCILWPNEATFRGMPKFVHFCKRVFDSTIATSILSGFPILWFFVFLIVNVVLYAKIINQLSSSFRPDIMTLDTVQQSSRVSGQFRTKTRNQVGIMLILNGSILFFCQAPTHVNRIFRFVPTRILRPAQLNKTFWAFQFLVLFNSCVNPFIYMIASKQYRDAFQKTFLGWLKPAKVSPLNVPSIKNQSNTVSSKVK